LQSGRGWWPGFRVARFEPLKIRIAASAATPSPTGKSQVGVGAAGATTPPGGTGCGGGGTGIGGTGVAWQFGGEPL